MNSRTTTEHAPSRPSHIVDKIGRTIKDFYRKRRNGIATGIGTLAMLGGFGAVGTAVVHGATKAGDRLAANMSEAMQPTHLQRQYAAVRKQTMVPVASEHHAASLSDIGDGQLATIGILLMGAGGLMTVRSLREASRRDTTPRLVEPAAATADEMPHLTHLFSDRYKLTPGQHITAWAIGGLAGAGVYAQIGSNAIATKVQHEIKTWQEKLEVQRAELAQQPYNAFASYHCPGADMPAFDAQP
jgi:hypothetical protein